MGLPCIALQIIYGGSKEIPKTAPSESKKREKEQKWPPSAEPPRTRPVPQASFWFGASGPGARSGESGKPLAGAIGRESRSSSRKVRRRVPDVFGGLRPTKGHAPVQIKSPQSTTSTILTNRGTPPQPILPPKSQNPKIPNSQNIFFQNPKI